MSIVRCSLHSERYGVLLRYVLNLLASAGGQYAAPVRTDRIELRSVFAMSGWLTSCCIMDGTRGNLETRYLWIAFR